MTGALWVGLTGGIATGKSTVSKYLQSRGFPVIDADLLAQQAVVPGSEGLKLVISQFGTEFLNERTELDRKKLGEKVFADPNALLKLEAILHPLVQSRVRELRQQYEKAGAKVIFYDVPLLFEKKLQDQFDKIVVVASTEDLQRLRMKQRNQWSEEESLRRLKNQLPMQEKIKAADYVIENNSDLTDLKKNVDLLIQKIQSSNA